VRFSKLSVKVVRHKESDSCCGTLWKMSSWFRESHPLQKTHKDGPPAGTVYPPQAWQVIGDSGNRGAGIHF
jgi:hypothetical protein